MPFSPSEAAEHPNAILRLQVIGTASSGSRLFSHADGWLLGSITPVEIS